MELGYLFILINSFLLCGMTAARKEYQLSAGATLKSTLTFMCISSLFVTIIGVIYACFTDFAVVRNADGLVIGLSALFAVILTVNTCLCIFGAKYGSLAILTMFAILGTLVISTFYGLIANPEANKLSVYNVIGLILAGVIITLSYIAEKLKSNTDAIENKNSKIFILICLLVFLFNGSALSIYSFFTSNRAQYGNFNFIFLYLFFCTVICAVVLGIIWLTTRKKSNVSNSKSGIKARPLIFTLVYGGLFCLAEFLSLTTTSILPIVIQAPLSFAVEVVIIALVDFLVYKQKLTKIQIAQIVLAIISGVCFAL